MPIFKPSVHIIQYMTGKMDGCKHGLISVTKCYVEVNVDVMSYEDITGSAKHSK